MFNSEIEERGVSIDSVRFLGYSTGTIEGVSEDKSKVNREIFMDVQSCLMVSTTAGLGADHNVKLKSKKNKELLMYKNDKWNVLPFASGLDEIFNKLFTEMQRFIRNHKDEVIEELGGEDELESFNRLMYAAYHKLDERRAKEVRKEADTGIICALEGHRMVV